MEGNPTTGSRSPKSAPSVPRSRRDKRVSGDQRERKILASAEHMMNHRPYHDISIDAIAEGAGITRPTFYFYFASKDAVLLALLDDLISHVHGMRATAMTHLAADPRAAWRDTIGAFYTVLSARRSLVLAGAAARQTNTGVDLLWTRMMNRWIADAAEAIEAERSRGAAPSGLGATDIAASLILMNERVMLAAFAGDRSAGGEDRVLDVLVDIWLGAVYRSTAFDAQAPP